MASQQTPTLADLYSNKNVEILQERICVLVGKTGAGKSSLANLMIGSKTSGTLASCTTQPQMRSTRIVINDGNYNFRIVDTPGLFDTTKVTNEQIADRIFDFMELEIPKVNMIFFVLKSGRFTEEEIATFSFLRHMLGPDVGQCCALVITNAERLNDAARKQLQDEIERDAKYKDLLEMKQYCKLGLYFCGNIGDLEDPEEVAAAVIKRIANDQKKLQELLATSSTEQYRTQLMKYAELRRDRKAEEVKAQIRRELEEQQKSKRANGGCVLI